MARDPEFDADGAEHAGAVVHHLGGGASGEYQQRRASQGLPSMYACAAGAGGPRPRVRIAGHRLAPRWNGMRSGLTAPPEMMKVIAWSTDQSVGVSCSTGTISR